MKRKDFIKTIAVGSSGFFIVPRNVLGRGFISPSDQLAIGAIGTGNTGFLNISKVNSIKNARIVTLCDVDDRRSIDARRLVNKASYYNDFREMLGREKNNLDAVIVSIPDHNHAVASMATMQLGKHIYCESPLCHDIYESRMLSEASKKYRVITQMGNQGSSGEHSKIIIEWIKKGVIGNVNKVHIWTNGKLTRHALNSGNKNYEIPPELKWLFWLGTAKDKKFSQKYLDGGWKAWTDFGTGNLGSDGPHLIDIPFKALDLYAPISVQIGTGVLTIPQSSRELYPENVTLHFLFARKDAASLELIWYDGGLKPQRPEELLDGEQMGDERGGMLFEGSKYKLIAGYYGSNPKVLPSKQMQILGLANGSNIGINNHQANWVNACMKFPDAELSSSFKTVDAPMETLLLGNVALRSYQLNGVNHFPENKTLEWDARNMKVTNFDEANELVKRKYREGWGGGA